MEWPKSRRLCPLHVKLSFVRSGWLVSCISLIREQVLNAMWNWIFSYDIYSPWKDMCAPKWRFNPFPMFSQLTIQTLPYSVWCSAEGEKSSDSWKISTFIIPMMQISFDINLSSLAVNLTDVFSNCRLYWIWPYKWELMWYVEYEGIMRRTTFESFPRIRRIVST